METIVTPYHLQLTNGLYPSCIESGRALEIGVTYRCNIFTFTDPDSPYAQGYRLLKLFWVGDGGARP